MMMIWWSSASHLLEKGGGICLKNIHFSLLATKGLRHMDFQGICKSCLPLALPQFSANNRPIFEFTANNHQSDPKLHQKMHKALACNLFPKSFRWTCQKRLGDLNYDLSLASSYPPKSQAIEMDFFARPNIIPKKNSFSFIVCFAFQSCRHLAVCDDECCLYHFGDGA